VTARTRLRLLPDVPTVVEAGLELLVSESFGGIVGPAGTPVAIVKKLNAEINAAVRTPDFKARLAEIGAEPRIGTPDEFKSLLASELHRWTEMATASGVGAGPPR
jgi:tripartite-type tricarboxylate transporter receptor subunit TctC